MEDFTQEKENMPINDGHIVLEKEALASLVKMSKWAKFLSILGFITVFIMLLAGIVVVVIGGTLPNFGMGLIEFSFIGIFYIALSGFYYFPSKYLFDFANSINKLNFSHSSQDLTSVAKNISKLITYIGIMTIVLFSAYILMFIIAISMGSQLFSQLNQLS